MATFMKSKISVFALTVAIISVLECKENGNVMPQACHSSPIVVHHSSEGPSFQMREMSREEFGQRFEGVKKEFLAH